MPDQTADQPLPDLHPQRLTSLDAYRGLTMLLMASEGFGLAEVARNLPNSRVWQELGYQTSHVEWGGCTVWDLIQPSFMFMVGVSMVFSYCGRQARGQSYGRMFMHAVTRAIVLVLLGVFLRSNHATQTYWTFEDVLSQIGWGYVCLFLLWNRPWWVQLAAAIVILGGYWALFAFWPLPGPNYDYAAVAADPQGQHWLQGFAAHWNKNANPAHYFDVWFLNLFPRENPFIRNSGGYQTLSFIPSLATMIFGLLAGGVVRSDRKALSKVALLVAGAVVGVAAGLALDHYGLCPIVKRIWTPGWALFSGGWCLLLLAAFYLVIDVWGFRAWAWPAVVVGMNSIVIYVMTYLAADWIHRSLLVHIGPTLFDVLGEPYRPLAEHLCVLGVMWLILYWLYRQRIFIRI
jgi:predicted acyltransferase